MNWMVIIAMVIIFVACVEQDNMNRKMKKMGKEEEKSELLKMKLPDKD